ncbi:MAG TPA: hypothetical protein VL485_21670 [Ktedonobacteraceae bacterium]|jgi:hypothetical protein|nr:hypothetical protein [Ktedonobacteraceae bacterium]
MLVVTLLCTGIGTFLIGLMPEYSRIGVAAPILVSLLRFLQGISVGGHENSVPPRTTLLIKIILR